MNALVKYENSADFAMCCPLVDTVYLCFQAGTAKKLRSQIATQVFHLPFILKIKTEDGSWIPVGDPLLDLNNAYTITTKLLTMDRAEELLQHALIKRDRLDNIVLAHAYNDDAQSQELAQTRPTAVIYAFPTKRS